MMLPSKEVAVPTGGSVIQWVKSLGYKLPLVLISVLLLVVVWVSPAPSFLSYSQLSDSQIEAFLSSPAQREDLAPISNSPVDTGQTLPPGGSTTGAESEFNISRPAVQSDTPTGKKESDQPGQKQQPDEQTVQHVPDSFTEPPKENTTVSSVDSQAANYQSSNVTTEAVVPEDSDLAIPKDPTNATTEFVVPEDSTLVDVETVPATVQVQALTVLL